MLQKISFNKNFSFEKVNLKENQRHTKNFILLSKYMLKEKNKLSGELEIRYSSNYNFLYSYLSDINWKFGHKSEDKKQKKFVLLISNRINDTDFEKLKEWVKFKNQKILGNFWDECIYRFCNVENCKKLYFYDLFAKDLDRILTNEDNVLKNRDTNKKNKIKLSIVTVVFNDEKKIEQTIQSVIAQNRIGIEYIVIDGNSSDNTKKIIEKYLEYIDIFISEPDNGIFDAMNKAIKLSRGELHLFLNSGDFLLPETIDMNMDNEGIIDVWYEDRLGNTRLRKKNHPILGMPYPHQGYLLNMKKKQFDKSYTYAADYNYLLSNKKNITKKYDGGVYFDNTGVSSVLIHPRVEVIKIQIKYFGIKSLPFVLFNLIKILGMIFIKSIHRLRTLIR